MNRHLIAILTFAILTCACNGSGGGSTSTPAPASPTPAATPTAAPFSSPAAVAEGMTMSPSGLQYQIVEAGTGMRPLFNQTVRVRYSGAFPNGVVFDTNVDNSKPPLEFKLGQRDVIKGWDIGVGGGPGIPAMRVGERRKLIVPPDLGYGKEPYGTIPGNSILTFDITLVGIKQ